MGERQRKCSDGYGCDCSDGYGYCQALQFDECEFVDRLLHGSRATGHFGEIPNQPAYKHMKTSRSIPHKKTRVHHANETAEDYVEAVFDVIEEEHECRVNDLARHFDVSHVTVSRIVNRLQREGLLETAPYQPITLTKKGTSLAVRVKKRHEIVFQFLMSLGIQEKTAQIDSEGIEHHVSAETLAAMKRFLRNQE